MSSIIKASIVTILLTVATVITITKLKDSMENHRAYMAVSNSGQIMASCERIMIAGNSVNNDKLTSLREFCARIAPTKTIQGK